MRAPSVSRGGTEGEAVPAGPGARDQGLRQGDANCRAWAPEEGTLEHAAVEAPGKCPKQQARGSRAGTCAPRDPRLPPRPSEPHLRAPTCTCKGIQAKESQPRPGTAPNYAEPGNQCLWGCRCAGSEGFPEAGSSLQVSLPQVEGGLGAGAGRAERRRPRRALRGWDPQAGCAKAHGG